MVSLRKGITMLLKISAFIYRHFSIFTKYARKKEQQYIKSLSPNTSDFEKNILISVWQANHGFYRASKHLKRDHKKLLKRLGKYKR